MRHPGHPSRQITLVPPTAIDVRFGRPPAPEGFTEAEVRLWEKLVLARRPNFFLGSEPILQAYVATLVNNQRIEAALRRARVGPSPRFVTLSRLHRQGALAAATLATRLRLTPASTISKNVSPDGSDKPVAVASFGYPQKPTREPDDVALVDANGERSFEKLRQSLHRYGPYDQHEPPAATESKNGNLPNLDSADVKSPPLAEPEPDHSAPTEGA